jgi:hypothetical protein
MATYNKNPGGGGKRPKPKNPPRTSGKVKPGDKFKGIKPAPMPTWKGKGPSIDSGIAVKPRKPTRQLKPAIGNVQPLRSKRKK